MATNNKQTGLGRGFDSLIPQNFDDTLLMDEQERIQKLLISDIKPGSSQPRSTFDNQLLQELAASIKQHGILQPVIVRISGDDGYTLVAGERRWRAAQIAGLTHIPAIVRSLEELEQLQIALVENVQRVDLSPLEQAASIKRLADQFSMSYEDIARKLGKATSTVHNTARLVRLPLAAQEALRDNLINEGHARALLALNKDPERQAEMLRLIIKNRWTVRQAEQFAAATKEGVKDVQAARQRTTTTTPATEKLSEKLGTPVSIRRLARGGKLQISFTSDEELDELISLLAKLRKS